MKLKDKKIRVADSEKHIIHPDKLWAYYRHASTAEVSQAGINGYERDAVFVINWRDDLEEGGYIEYNGVVYEISQIDDYEGYKRDLTLYCTHLVRAVRLIDWED